jgi:hypothetical protein
MLGAPASLRIGDRAPRRALRTHVTHRDEALMRDVRADLAARPVNPLLDLLRERVDARPRPRPRRDGNPPPTSSRARTQCATVLWSQPASCAAPRSVPVRSNASRISITSSELFKARLPARVDNTTPP